MSRMKVIAIEDADTWPVEAVLADLDDPEGPLLRWRQGPRADATTLDVRELLGEGSWRFVDLDLPPDWEEGYVASWRGKVGFVHGTPQPVPPLPRWMLTIPNPDRTKRLVRFASRAGAAIGLFGLVVGTLLVIAGAPGGWFHTAWSVALLWQVWGMSGHGRESVRFVATRLIPLLFFVIAFLVTGAAAIRTLAQGDNIGRGVGFACATLLDLVFVTFGTRLAIRDWPRVTDEAPAA
jgi:hypothetical protein